MLTGTIDRNCLGNDVQ